MYIEYTKLFTNFKKLRTLSVHLDTVYFTENLKQKKIIFGLLFTFKITVHMPILHCSWDMNNARGTELKQKKKRQTQENPNKA